MSKKKKVVCINCGTRIGRHEQRLEFRLGDTPVYARVEVSRESKWLPRRIYDALLKIFKYNPDRVKRSWASHDLRPVIYTHLGNKCKTLK